MRCTSEGGLYACQVALKTYLRFTTQLWPAADWLVYQAEGVHGKTVCLGSCNKVVYHNVHLPFYIL